MVQTFKPPKKSRKPNHNNARKQPEVELNVEAIDHEAVGIAKSHQPLVFVEGALPGEKCRVALTDQKKNFSKAKVIEVMMPHQDRITPFCQHFNTCGGCQTQYLDHQNMLELKQVAVTNLLQRMAGLEASDLDQGWQSPVIAKGVNYRRKARLAVDFRRENQPLIGYRGKGSNQIVDINDCPVLQHDLLALLKPIKEVCANLQSTKAIGHIELLQGDEYEDVTASENLKASKPLVVFRMTKMITAHDKTALVDFAETNQCALALEYKAGEFEVLAGSEAAIHYCLPESVQLRVQPNDFMQINAEVNREMVATVLDWLELTSEDRILDLFCGMGNFSLPIAKKAGQVYGVEGVSDMVQHAHYNAQQNDISNVEFFCKDLEQTDALQKWSSIGINKVVLDPSRSGAKQLMEQIVELKPEKVLYVSCNPATFGRDIANLTASSSTPTGKKKGSLYKLDKIALLDMFPYTAHSEVISLFVRQKN